MNAVEKMLRDDYALVSGGLVSALDVLDQVYGLLRLGEADKALAVVAAARQGFGWGVRS